MKRAGIEIQQARGFWSNGGRFGSLIYSVLIWTLIASIPAMIVGLKFGGVGLRYWLSTIAGPFAFADQSLFAQDPTLVYSISIIFLALMLTGPVYGGYRWNAVTALGVSVWFISGFSITYIAV